MRAFRQVIRQLTDISPSQKSWAYQLRFTWEQAVQVVPMSPAPNIAARWGIGWCYHARDQTIGRKNA